MAAALLLACGCRLQDVRTVEINAPQVKTDAARERVMAELQKLRGVELNKTQFDFEKGTVTITYDSMQVAIKNIEFAFLDAGFDANKLKAEPAAKAKLPAESP